MKKITSILFLLLLLACSEQKFHSSLLKLPDTNLNVIVANDMGRRGVSEQKNIAGLLGEVAAQNKIAFMAVAGDPIHDDGVKNIDDEEWNLKIENIYTAPSLYTIPWYVISGNHEYHGNVQAILDYSQKSKRWNAPARYFTVKQPIGDSGKECLFVFVDTSPIIDKYRNNPEEYPEAGSQDLNAQLAWIKQTLESSDADWKIVIGHHPVYADTEKVDSERIDMQNRLASLLENNGVAFYICGHIHNFQHIKPKGSKVNYIVNSSASKSRKVKPIEGTVFCNPDPGFSVMSITTDRIDYYMENHKGKVVYTYTVKK
ncbi:acid phosphatase [Bacteroidia bacterium]|nr:acid phosphatase [Bacteroidia bacterium]